MSTYRGGTACLADPRWHWLQRALSSVYAELEPGDRVLSFGITIESGGQLLSYGVGGADGGLRKAIIPDMNRAACAVNRAVVEITPPDAPGTP